MKFENEEKLKIGWLSKGNTKIELYTILTPYALYFFDSYKEGSELKSTLYFDGNSKVTKLNQNSFKIETEIQTTILSSIDFEEIDDWIEKLQKCFNHYKPKITFIEKEVFKEMKTDQGPTISELCGQGAKVLLYFLSSLGCIFCQGRILDLYNMYEPLCKLNIVVVLLYNESTNVLNKFIQMNERHKEYIEMFFTMKQNQYNEIFQIKKYEKLSLDNIMTTFSDNYRSQLKRLKGMGLNVAFDIYSSVQPQTPTVFLVQNDELINEYRPENKSIRFDFSKIIIDPLDYGNSKADSINFKFKPRVLKKKKKILFKSMSFTIKNTKEKSEEKPLQTSSSFSSLKMIKQVDSMTTKHEIPKTVEDILRNPNFLKFFKVHLTNELAIENLIFYEEVEKYKKMDLENRRRRSGEMIEIFFNSSSQYEINTSQKLIDKLLVEKENADINLFLDIEKDVFESCFIDSFVRFKKTQLYYEMLNPPTSKKNSYSIL